MKKALSIMMCYAIGMVAFSLNAATQLGVLSQIDFSNDALWGKMPKYGLDDLGGEDSVENKFWWCFGEGNSSLITNYAPHAERYDRFAEWDGEPNPRPDYMSYGDNNRGYVEFLTASPLARTFHPVKSDGTSIGENLPSKDGLFVDTLVKFVPRAARPSDGVPFEATGKAKFMCWLSAPSAEGDEPVATNLVVSAGRYDAEGNLAPVNYVVTNRVEAGRWYRLTARALRNAATADGVSAPCFALYLDGVPVACEASAYVIGENMLAMDKWFAGNELYEAHALFPPMRPYETLQPKLTGFAVQGCGAFDEFGVVKTGNPLAYGASEIDFLVTLDPNAVTSVTCSVTGAKDQEPRFVTNTAGVAEILFRVRPGDKVRVAALTSSAHSLAATLSISGNRDAVYTWSGYDVTMISGTVFDDASRVVARINTGAAYFRVGDVIYESVQEAMAAAVEAGAPLVLENDVLLDPAFSVNGQMRVLPVYDLVFDLNGRTLTGQNFRDEAAIYDQGRLTVIDSVGGGAIIAPGTAIEVVSTNDALEANHEFASLTLGSESVRGEFEVKGRVSCTQGELMLMGGTYLTPWNLEPTNGFYLAGYVAPGRFEAEELGETETIAGRDCHWWRVAYDGRLTVRYEAEVGACDPAFVHAAPGSLLTVPAVTNALGYSVTNWCVAGAGASWDFASDMVESNMTLVAQMGLDRYSISYDQPGVTEPSSYTVRSVPAALPVPQRDNFTFAGWRDQVTGLIVREVGEGAVFVGTETPVAGDLDLVAVWLPDTLRWENTSGRASESNGTYAGTWRLTLPMQDTLPMGTAIAIDEIAFCIVNPHLYPKTAEHLSVASKDGGEAAVLSSAREYRLDEGTKEYLSGTGADTLANGRSKVCYRFENLVLKVGYEYAVRFCDGDGQPAVGFLRLAYVPNANDPVFGNCTEKGGDPESEEYLKYCPLYEVTGHPAEEGHE